MEKVFKRPHALTDIPLHYCPGCPHGIVHRLVAEVIDELGIEGSTIGTIILNVICRRQHTEELPQLLRA